jgi:lipopolysaccharide transport system ATP-binding protein
MSNDVAIRVEKLGKMYRIGAKREGYKTVRDTVAGLFRRNGSGQSPKSEPFWALKDVSFEIKRGEVVGVIGRNGAGKSTLLKILSRITEPTEGFAEIRGRVGSLLEVGTGFHPELSGRENIFLNGAILGMRRFEIEHKFDEIVAFAEVEKFIDTPVKHYSSGMYLRLAFAVAAHLETEILLVDEVLAVGDIAFQKRCLGKMEEVAKAGRTVIFVSHNMAAVSQLCSKGLVLQNGQVASCRSAAEAVSYYHARGSFAVPERRWASPQEAPGDDRVRLLACRVIQDDRTVPLADINKPLEIEIEFLVLRQCENLVTGVNLYNALGGCLFAHCDWRDNRLVEGHYSKKVIIPAPLLPEDRISVLIQLIFFRPHIQSVVQRDAVSFETVDSDSPSSVRGHYKGPWPGMVRIGLAWTEAKPLRGEPRA